jgi:PIN domain nuclease of toxin-antitoxin system
VICYLDTNVVIWLAGGDIRRISDLAKREIETADLLISPIVLLELEYLYEIGRIRIRARDVLLKIESELGARLCDLPFSRIASVALDEKWTRDPFDRLIVSNAKANGFSALLSADEEIGRNYPKTVW